MTWKLPCRGSDWPKLPQVPSARFSDCRASRPSFLVSAGVLHIHMFVEAHRPNPGPLAGLISARSAIEQLIGDAAYLCDGGPYLYSK